MVCMMMYGSTKSVMMRRICRSPGGVAFEKNPDTIANAGMWNA